MMHPTLQGKQQRVQTPKVTAEDLLAKLQTKWEEELSEST